MASHNMQTLLTLVAAAIGIWLFRSIVHKAVTLRNAFKALGNTPGGSLIWLHPFRSSAPVLARIFPFKGAIGDYYANYDVYTKIGSTIVGTVKFWGSVPTFWVSDADALKVVSNNRETFRRDLEGYDVVSVYGPNMVATEGAEWKRYRAVSKPAFNEANNALVWLHATRVCNEWFDILDKKTVDGKPFSVDLLENCTEVALLILSSAAFGRHSSYGDHSAEETSHVHEIPFRPAVTSAVDNLIPKILIPEWLFTLAEHLPLPSIIKDTQDSFVALRLHMLDLVSSTRSWVAGGGDVGMDAALLQNLVKANMAENEEGAGLARRRLTDEEMISNIFMFLLAGHETSAHSLCFAIAHMAMYPEAQEKMYQETLKLWPQGAPTMESAGGNAFKDDMAKLEYITAGFRETLRLYPAVSRVASPVPVDTTLTAHRVSRNHKDNQHPSEFEVKIPANSLVVIDIIGLHRNPLHWGEDVNEYKPERFLDTATYHWPRHAFLAFSAGPRACMGERFAMVESVCILAQIVRRYKITVPDTLKGKDIQEQTKALMDWVPRMTLLPTNSFVNFTKRPFV